MSVRAEEDGVYIQCDYPEHRHAERCPKVLGPFKTQDAALRGAWEAGWVTKRYSGKVYKLSVPCLGKFAFRDVTQEGLA